MAEISIIMPVFNVEKFLSCTIESIINQDFNDWELILIDDGSTDTSGYICDNYAKSDSRIIVNHIKNSGVSNARNVGLKLASGKFVVFADSDDLCHHAYLGDMYQQITTTSCDIIFTPALLIGEEDNNVISEITGDEISIYSKNDNMNHLPSSFYYVVWGKIYDRNLFLKSNISFDVSMNRGEDTLFAYMTALLSSKIGFINNKYVNYRQRAGSLMSNKRSDSSLFVQSVHKYEVISNFIQSSSAVIDKELSNIILIESATASLSEFISCNLSKTIYYNNIQMLKENSELMDCLGNNLSHFTHRQRLTFYILKISSLMPVFISFRMINLINRV